jgi:hypothetical protein
MLLTMVSLGRSGLPVDAITTAKSGSKAGVDRVPERFEPLFYTRAAPEALSTAFKGADDTRAG